MFPGQKDLQGRKIVGPDSQRVHNPSVLLILGMACVGLEGVDLRRDLFPEPSLKGSKIFRPKKNYLFKNKCQKAGQR